MYEKAHSILKQRSNSREEGRIRGNYSRKYPLSSKLYCGFCGTVLTRRNMNSGSESSKEIWHCMRSVKMGKQYCEESRLIKEEIVEQAFVELVSILSTNNKNIINKFYNRVQNQLETSKPECIYRKKEQQIEVLRKKMDNYLELVSDGLMEKSTFIDKKRKLDNKIHKIEKELKCIKEDGKEKESISNGIDSLKNILNENLKIDKFDKDIFEAIIKYAIIGERTTNGQNNPYIIRFILKNGETFNNKRNLLDVETLLILEFESKQTFFIFEKDKNNFSKKKLIDGIVVRIEIEC